jgi:hypothetical protein
VSIENDLRQAAEEIRAAGLNGWGNTCEQAAARIAGLEAELERVKRAAINGMNAALTEQLERAEAALRELGKHPESCGDDCVSELARQDALAELVAARADAERYRRLRLLATQWPTTVLVVNYNIGHDWRTADAPDEIDGVVDNAIAARGAA